MVWSAFAIYWKSNIQIFLHIPLALPRNFRNWYQIFYNRSGSYKIHALPIFIFLVYRLHGDIDYCKKHIQPNFNFFPKTGVISTSTTVTEGCKTPTENTRYGPETTVSNHLQRNYCVSNQKATLDYQYY